MELLYFAWVAERIGKQAEHLEPPAADATISDVIDLLAARGGGYASAFADRARIRAALDQQFVGLDRAIGGARELALFPPVTGG